MDINELIKEKTMIFDCDYGINIWTVSPKGQTINYAFKKEFFEKFISDFEDFLNQNKGMIIRKTILEEVFRKEIFKEYRQSVARERVVIVCLNYLLLQDKISYVSPTKILVKDGKQNL